MEELHENQLSIRLARWQVAPGSGVGRKANRVEDLANDVGLDDDDRTLLEGNYLDP